MTTNLELRCACGAVQGVVAEASPKTMNRVVCYCSGCQAFVRFLERDDLMDASGGSDILQVAPSRLRFTVGADKLRSMRLSEKGLFRWYTDCCKVPVGNMLYSPKCPFVGIGRRFFVLQGDALDAVAGLSLGGMHGKDAIGGCPPGAHESASFGTIFRCVGWLLGNAIRGRYKPSPFWGSDGKPTAEPRVLSTDERMKFDRVV